MMLVHHLIGWYGQDPRGVLPGWEGFAITDVAAPAFTITLGASVPLLLASRRRRGVEGRALFGTVVRRYGLLIPIGIALRAAAGFDLGRTGVLETLGLAALITAAIAVATASETARWVVAVGTVTVAPWIERAAETRTDWVSTHLLTGTFPLVAYVGLALLGAAAVPALGRGVQRRPAAVAATIGIAATCLLLVAGEAPDRYPGGASFLVPGVTGTLLLYLAVTSPRLKASSHLGQLLQRAGAHTFGVFVGHYGIYIALRETGLLHVLADSVAAAAALVTTAALVWIAPRVPTPPWSPRTGWRPSAPAREEEAASPPPLPVSVS